MDRVWAHKFQTVVAWDGVANPPFTCYYPQLAHANGFTEEDWWLAKVNFLLMTPTHPLIQDLLFPADTPPSLSHQSDLQLISSAADAPAPAPSPSAACPSREYGEEEEEAAGWAVIK